MPDSVAIAAIVGGIVLIFLGVLDRGTLIKIFNAEISNTISSRFSKFLCFFFGSILIFSAIGLEAFSLINNPNVSPPQQEDTTITTPASPNFYATSYCSISNVYGYGENSNVSLAQDIAIDSCVFNGGIPDCCASNVRVEQSE